MKILFSSLAVIVIICGAIGIQGRCTHLPEIDISDKQSLADYQLNWFYLNADSVRSNIPDYDSCELVIKARSTGSNQIMRETSRQEIIVLEVYKGPPSLVGKTVQLFIPWMCFSHASHDYYGSYVNYMTPGDEYLVFMNSLDIQGIHKPYYRGLYFMSYFNFKDTNNTLLTPKSYIDIQYGDVINNEFFVYNQAALDEVLKIKKDLFSQYVEPA